MPIIDYYSLGVDHSGKWLDVSLKLVRIIFKVCVFVFEETIIMHSNTFFQN